MSAGQPASFTVTASGTAPLTYQWQRDGANISGATAASYTLSSAQLADSGAKFAVVVTNSGGSVTSNAATLTVNPVPPAITTQPSTQTVAAGQSVSFTVTATGTPTPSYQWQRGGANIPGETGASYTLSNAQLLDSGATFAVIVTNSGGSVTSNAATLTVLPAPPAITVQPSNATVAAGTAAAFTVTASGTPPLSYQWQRGGANISGATAASYTLSPAQLVDSGATFAVIVTNTVSSVTSIAATLTVTPVPPSITVQPSNATVTAGTAATFTVTATGTPTLSYQWQRNVANVWTNIAAATTNSYPVSSPGAPDDLAQFRVIVTNSGGSVTSSIALLTVNHTLSLVAGMLGGVGNKNAATPTSATFYSPQGVAVDTVNNVVYVADTQDHTIRKIDSTGAVTTFAGTQNTAGLINGTGVAARFNSPRGITVDGAGNVYVADTGNNAIRMITPLGAVTTLAGNGSAGSIDGTGAAARFKAPAGITVDIAGATLYVADTNNDTIRAVTTGGGVVTTFAGFAGTAAWLDDPTTPTNARFNGPAGITMDAAGNLYIADTQNSVIRVISTIGAVTTLAGDGTFGYQDGIGTGSRFGGPTALAVDSAGTAVYVADQGSQTIRAVTTTALGVNGIVTTLAGTNNITGWTDATGSSARFYTPTGIATDGTTVYVADLTTSLIRAVTASSGAVVTYAGNIGGRGALDASTGAAARFDNSHGVASDSAGNLYVADWGNNTIRMITPAGVVTTVAGQAGVAAGFKDATGTAARFNSPRSVATDASGNVYVADSLNRVIRMISMPGPAAVVTTLAGIPGTTGRADGAAGTGTFGLPTGVATDSSGNVYVADWGNNSIRMVTPGGNLTTIAGSTTGTPGAANGTLAASLFRGPRGLVVDSNGVIYVADRDNALIRKVDVAGDLVTTVAGLAATPGFKDALTGPGTAARFNWPAAIAVDTSGNLYVADYNNNAIRKVTPGGVVTTVAGANGSFGVALGNLPGSLSGPSGISVIGGTGTALRIAIADALENSILRAALP